MLQWNTIPLLRMLLPFLLALLVPLHGKASFWIAAVIAAVLLLMCVVPAMRPRYTFAWIYGVLSSLCVGLVASALVSQRSGMNSARHFTKFESFSSGWVVQVASEPTSTKNGIRFFGTVTHACEGDRAAKVLGEVLVYVSGQEALRLRYGDVLYVRAVTEPVAGPRNPGEFSYKEYLAGRSVYRQLRVSERSLHLLERDRGNPLVAWSQRIRCKLLERIRAALPEEREYAVCAALVLGSDDGIDRETMADYSGSGALHVLSVSGLHVAIVYLVLGFLLGWLDRIRHGAVVRTAVMLLLLWLYACLTGLSPSVLRSAAMISFVVVSKLIGRSTSIYNTLSASALLLLAMDPLLAGNVGFQLSYLAVAGIVTLQPLIKKIWEPDSWIACRAWDLATVSLAAQLSTFPLSLYYFHQFPNYFLPANFIVIPLSTVILYLGLGFLALGFITGAAQLLSTLLSASVRALNASVHFINHLPGAVTEDVACTLLQCLAIYFLIALLFHWLYSAAYRTFLALLVTLIFLVWTAAPQSRHDTIICFSSKKGKHWAYISGQQALLVTDQLNVDSVRRSFSATWLHFSVESDLVKMHRSADPWRTLNDLQPFFQLVGSGKEKIRSSVQCVVTDASTYRAVSGKIRQQLFAGQAFHQMRTAGAFVYEINEPAGRALLHHLQSASQSPSGTQLSSQYR